MEAIGLVLLAVTTVLFAALRVRRRPFDDLDCEIIGGFMVGIGLYVIETYGAVVAATALGSGFGFAMGSIVSLAWSRRSPKDGAASSETENTGSDPP